METEEDRLLAFLGAFAGMSEAEREEALDALSDTDRSALVDFAAARAATVGADLVDVLDAGHAGLDRLRAVADPAQLLTVINLAARERPELLAEALFAAIVLYRGWGASQPPEVVRLREQWHWHVHEQIEGEHEQDG